MDTGLIIFLIILAVFAGLIVWVLRVLKDKRRDEINSMDSRPISTEKSSNRVRRASNGKLIAIDDNGDDILDDIIAAAIIADFMLEDDGEFYEDDDDGETTSGESSVSESVEIPDRVPAVENKWEAEKFGATPEPVYESSKFEAAPEPSYSAPERTYNSPSYDSGSSSSSYDSGSSSSSYDSGGGSDD